MGGASEDDEAMKWFLHRAKGGDILVLRASGSDGYNDYLYSELGVTVNSVETILCYNGDSAFEPYILDKISKAEAIWFAGGDQNDYVSYWKDTPVDSLINAGLRERNIVIGGTSAGMAIMGRYIYTGKNGSVTSENALTNPYNSRVTIDSNFIDNKYLEDVITDTHYDDPDRRGRHVTFLARILTDHDVLAKGIACDERTAVCIEPNGIAHVYGSSSSDYAYFISPNCALSEVAPEVCTNNTPLTWNRNDKALWVYKVKGNIEGTNKFNLKDWLTGNGGVWEDWWVNYGVLNMKVTSQTDCTLLSNNVIQYKSVISVYPNPSSDVINVELNNSIIQEISIYDVSGKVVFSKFNMNAVSECIDISGLRHNVYFIIVKTRDEVLVERVVKM